MDTFFSNSDITYDDVSKSFLRIKNPPFPRTWYRVDCVVSDLKAKNELKQYILDNYEGRFGFYCTFVKDQCVIIIRFESLDSALLFKLQIGSEWKSEK